MADGRHSCETVAYDYDIYLMTVLICHRYVLNLGILTYVPVTCINFKFKFRSVLQFEIREKP